MIHNIWFLLLHQVDLHLTKIIKTTLGHLLIERHLPDSSDLLSITQNQLDHKLIPKTEHQVRSADQPFDAVYVHVQQEALAKLLDAELVEGLEVVFVFGDKLLEVLG
jgi:hypothetical protein